MEGTFKRDLQYAKFSAYGFLKNLRFFEPFLILFFLQRGVSYLEIGTLYAIREICVNVLEIPTGVIADAAGRRRTMVLSFLGYLVSFVLFYFSHTFGLFVVAMFLFAFGDAFRTGTHKAMIMAYLRIKGWTELKTDYYGHTRSWSQVGSAVSSLIAAAIVFYSGNYSTVFLFSTIPYVADLLLMLTYPKELDGTTRAVSLAELWQRMLEIGRETITAARNPQALRVLINASMFTGFYKGAKDFLQPLVRTLALSLPILVTLDSEKRSAVSIGVIYSLLYIGTSFAARFSNRTADRLGGLTRSMNLELAAGIIAGVLVGVFYALGYPIVAVLIFILIYIIQNLRQPVAVSFISNSVSDDIQATVLSVQSQVQSLFAAVIAFLIGALADLFGGSIGMGIGAVSLLVLLSVPLYLVKGNAETRSA